MKLYGSILLALCLVTAGCGDEDSVENPIAPTAAETVAATAASPASQDTAQNATQGLVPISHAAVGNTCSRLEAATWSLRRGCGTGVRGLKKTSTDGVS